MKTFLLSLLLLLSLTACNKDNEAVPDTNADGEYFNCKIDGKYWTYKQKEWSNHDALSAGTEITSQRGYFIRGDNAVDYPQTIVRLRMNGLEFPNRDTVMLVSFENGAYSEVTSPPPDELSSYGFSTDSIHVGKVVFTKRTTQRLEGTFYFDAYNADLNRVVRFTEGRFSVIP